MLESRHTFNNTLHWLLQVAVMLAYRRSAELLAQNLLALQRWGQMLAPLYNLHCLLWRLCPPHSLHCHFVYSVFTSSALGGGRPRGEVGLKNRFVRKVRFDSMEGEKCSTWNGGGGGGNRLLQTQQMLQVLPGRLLLCIPLGLLLSKLALDDLI